MLIDESQLLNGSMRCHDRLSVLICISYSQPPHYIRMELQSDSY